MSDFNRFKEQITSTDGRTLTDEELEEIYYPPQKYVRTESTTSPERIAELRRKLKRKWARRALREKIARFIFRF